MHIGLVDNGFSSFRCFDIRVPPRVVCIEVANNDRFFWKGDITDSSFNSSLIVVWGLGLFIVDVQEECR